ncbi:2-dehydro-3-deoxyphosphogluconate aldolase/(4S)-4-hydroxy-2-oxoglutarate aldolase [Sporomusaceae bacterium BoRhaA]|uniref:bifunctional 2-keto-4-hydroxyglutarate aldolase/2-keto-3-deoxy-6-phosphogluconate aldolase n=1 Tax=Pelorhabdus rhamnosifermentans TaxID=2772457 RepID=UPI001C062728|nr:bifunctional 2-keto-4-hydroxyglutarate aldolase/2-keto-3-deoxy-6-phosphogluconate aldolase [Pelorhabdus rhamnosifermentans]MBU2702732.1 2-dehydro-3-deoxyphosphogluconate aldolase/(4S)-4-hydroxy-2-oxoglutarate aldolase [Pelorhabdus rhamnosifermentans]
MLKKSFVLSKLTDVGVVAVVRANEALQAKKIAEACMLGGVFAIEITFTVPGAAKVMEELRNSYGQEQLLLGAGTVLDSETARIALLNGADFVVTPAFNKEAVRLCNRYGVPILPGAMSVKEAIEAMEAGADIIKVFPGELFGPKIIKALKGPLPQGNFMPTGGVDVSNVQEWIKAGAVAVGVGSALTGSALSGDYMGVTTRARELVKNVKQARMM